MGKMWEGQRELRWSMERIADDALDRAGVELDPRGFLVGLPETDPTLPVLVEPPRASFAVEDLGDLLGDADRLYARQLKKQDLDDDASEEHREHHRAALLEGCRRQVVADALHHAAKFDDRAVVVGMSCVVGDYRVFPVLAVTEDSWDELPSLTSSNVDGHPVDTSFQEAVVHDVLRAASRELDRSEPTTLMGVDAGAILRSAADTFINGVVSRTGQDFAQGCRDAFDAVSAQTYEGRAGLGSIVLARRGHPAVQEEISFDHPVPITVPRSFRKVLEMAGRGLALLCDGREVYGLGQVDDDAYRRSDEDVFVARIVGNGSWELWHAGTPFLRMDNGQPGMPRDLMDPDTFSDTLKRVFPKASAEDAQALWGMAEACTRQMHGTMLVVHPDAEAEGERLLPQAHTISPTRLGPRAFTTLTNIDGAVLVSPDGLTHAVGVILDGEATGTGDSSRGARYNSAIRYLAGNGKGSMVIIVSEDGKIDLLPKLMRRVRRSTVQRAVDRLVASAEEGDSYEKFARLDRTCVQLEFYLNQEQCDLVNDARESVEQRRWEEERVRLQVVPVQPHPAMDDSYFIEPVA